VSVIELVCVAVPMAPKISGEGVEPKRPTVEPLSITGVTEPEDVPLIRTLSVHDGPLDTATVLAGLAGS